jgi:hypothetical protein
VNEFAHGTSRLPANEDPPEAMVVAALAEVPATTAEPITAIAAITPAIFRIIVSPYLD